jgi:transketolase
MRAELAKLCFETVKTDVKSVVMVGDISHFLLRETEQLAPDRFYNIGICEQSMIGMASGMAIEGLRPIVHTIAPFLVERAHEQIKVDLGYQHTEVTIVTVGGTYDYSDLGCTHHCYNDIALMKSIPNMEVYEPGTPKEFRELFTQTWGNGNPKYFRLSAHTHSQDVTVQSREVNVIRDSVDGKWVFVTGHLLDDVLEDSTCGVIYVSTLHSVSKNSIEMLSELFKNQPKLYSVENHFKIGGLGDLVSDIFNLPVKRIGLDRKFLTNYGSYDDLRKESNMDRESILRQIYE